MPVQFRHACSRALSAVLAAEILQFLLLLFSSLYIDCVDGVMILDTSGSNPGENKLSFTARWHDTQASREREFVLSFFPDDSSLEIYEPGRRQWLLRRIKPVSSCSRQEVHVEDLYPGSWVRVYGRRLLIADYASEATRRLVAPSVVTTFAMLKPDGVKHLAEVLAAINSSGIRVTQAKMVSLSAQHAALFYSEHRERAFFPTLVDYISSGPVVGLRLMGPDAVSRWREMIGPTDSARARESSPRSLRARFGTDGTRNALHGSDGAQAAETELDWFFSEQGPQSPVEPGTAGPSTCAVVLPHAVRAGLVPELLREFDSAGFLLTGLLQVELSEESAAEMMTVYSGVLPEFRAMVHQLSDGPALALRLAAPCAADTHTAVEQLRSLAGPRDPAVAALLRPNSLRAKFGVDRVLNVIHCSDMAEEADNELCFLFSNYKQR